MAELDEWLVGADAEHSPPAFERQAGDLVDQLEALSAAGFDRSALLSLLGGCPPTAPAIAEAMLRRHRSVRRAGHQWVSSDDAQVQPVEGVDFAEVGQRLGWLSFVVESLRVAGQRLDSPMPDADGHSALELLRAGEAERLRWLLASRGHLY